MWSSIVACMALAIGLAHAQMPQHCFAPPELTFNSVSFNHQQAAFRRFEGEYDARNERLAFRGDSRHGTHASFYWIIMLYRERTAYEINIEKRSCEKFPLRRFYHFGVPEHAKYEDAYAIGGPGESFEADEWFEPHLVGGKSWVGVFTRRRCYPVSTFVFQNHRNETTTHQFNNVVEGILDPAWFVPPEACRNATWATPSRMASDLNGHVGWF